MPRSCEPETCETLHFCSACQEAKPCTDYYRRKNITPDGRDRRGERVTRCKSCATAARSAYRTPERSAAYGRMWKYGLTQERFESMLAAQGSCCAICRAEAPGGRGTWAIDHDHSCCPGPRSCGNCLRSLLCTRCNTGLGQFRDDPHVLREAAKYVELHQRVPH